MGKISTSSLAKKLNIDAKELNQALEEQGYIEMKKKSLFSSEKVKVLSEKWKSLWGELKTWTKYWDYIVWPEDFNPLPDQGSIQDSPTSQGEQGGYLSVSQIAECFNLSARKMNQIISELAWIEPNIKWWKLTKFWEKIGWRELTIQKTGATYTKWPLHIKENPSLLSALWLETWEKIKVEVEKKEETSKKDSIEEVHFREKFPAQYRTKDGHNVRSRGELVIDNSLYEYGLTHAYERKLPIEEDVYSDFYIPAKNGWKAVYIEFWGLEDQEKYNARKLVKRGIYEKYQLNLIELENKHIDNLDDYLPRMLLEFGIKVD